MDITPISFWIIIAIATIFAGVIGFVIGRRKAPGGSDEIERVIAEYEAKQQELEAYQQKVHAHYNTTSNLFKDMAGSYKDLFDHLSVGYEQLGNPTAQRILPERAGALLDEVEVNSPPPTTDPQDK